MKVGFIGLGRMGEVMTRRLLDAGHEVGVYNRNAGKAKPLVDAGAKAVSSIKAAAQFGDAVFTMVSDDAAVLQVVGQPGGLKDSLPKGGIHICAGTHSVGAIQKLKEIHAEAGQFLIASPMLGRPEVVAAGQAGTVVGGPPDAVGPPIERPSSGSSAAGEFGEEWCHQWCLPGHDCEAAGQVACMDAVHVCPWCQPSRVTGGTDIQRTGRGYSQLAHRRKVLPPLPADLTDDRRQRRAARTCSRRLGALARR